MRRCAGVGCLDIGGNGFVCGGGKPETCTNGTNGRGGGLGVGAKSARACRGRGGARPARAVPTAAAQGEEGAGAPTGMCDLVGVRSAMQSKEGLRPVEPRFYGGPSEPNGGQRCAWGVWGGQRGSTDWHV